MATFKALVFSHQKRADGTYNIKIRVNHHMKNKYLPTVWYVTKNDLTRSLKLKNQLYIDLTDEVIRKYREACNRLGEGLKSMNVAQVVDYVTSDNDKKFDLDIVAYANDYIDELKKADRTGNAHAYQSAINNLVKFVGRERISINEITVKFLKDWMLWIGQQPARTNRTTGARSQSMYLAQVRAIHNRAKQEYNDEDAGIIRIPLSPFNKIKLPKPEVTRKRAVSIETLRAIVALPDTKILQTGTNRFNLAKDVFMLSFYLVGMNAVDLYHCTDYTDGRITYQRTKTKNRRADKAEISIKVEPEVMPLLEKYKDPTGERVFNFYSKYSTPGAFNMALNYGLKKIGPLVDEDDLEFYAARHSWATIAVNDAKVDKYTVHTALNHVDEGMRVTDIYIRKSWEVIDVANRKVLDLL